MPVRTPDELTDYLARELFWRKHELATINRQMHGADDHVQVVIRSGVCLLYAHWEGFVRAAADRYLEYVANRRLKFRELKRNFLVVDLLHRIGRLAQQRSVDMAKDLVDSVLDREREFSTESIGSITRSNLNSKVLMDLLNLVGIDSTEYRSKEPLLDTRLVKNRNSVAHGRWLEMETDDYVDLHEAIVGLMDRFRTDLEHAATTSGYLAT